MALRFSLTVLALAVVTLGRKLDIDEEEDNFPFKHEPWLSRDVPGDNKIVGGTEVVPNSIPYQASLRRLRKDGTYKGFCGGVVISTDHILTAAHCCDHMKSSPSSYGVWVGKHNIRETESTEQIQYVSRVKQHDGWRRGSGVANDICVLTLRKSLNYTDAVQPATLPQEDEEFTEGSPATVSGWGTLTFHGRTSNYLMSVDVPVVSDDDCSRAYRSQFNPDSMMCAGEAGHDSCQGDSGGPLTCGEDGQDKVLCGVVSWGRGCALRGYPGVYAKVSAYIGWIEGIVN